MDAFVLVLKRLKLRFFFIYLCSFLVLHVFAMPAEIILIRHGEKPKKGPELSQQGWLRAEKLPLLFKDHPEFTKYGKPAALYGMAPNRKKGSVRAIQTLKYLSDELAIPINSKFMRESYREMVEEIRHDTKLNGKLILICWEHKVLTDIAKALGVVNPRKYSGKDFDRVWLIDFKNSKNPTLSDLPQKLLPGDSKI